MTRIVPPLAGAVTYFAGVTNASICSLLERPTSRFVSLPSLKRIRVGIPRKLKRGDAAGFSSTFILYTLALPPSFSAAASTAGAIARHGPHHGAQKSTRIGSLDCTNSSSRAASLISCTNLLIGLLRHVEQIMWSRASACDHNRTLRASRVPVLNH